MHLHTILNCVFLEKWLGLLVFLEFHFSPLHFDRVFAPPQQKAFKRALLMRQAAALESLRSSQPSSTSSKPSATASALFGEDADDDDDEGDKGNNRDQDGKFASEAPNKGQNSVDNGDESGDDDEVDPLDAFMAGIDDQVEKDERGNKGAALSASSGKD